MRVLGLVPARGGSKGIPRKNVRLLAGMPLLEYTARTALHATRLTTVVLSTDDEEIAEIGRRAGLSVPFIRPAELARDETPMVPVVRHAVGWMEKHGQQFDAICLLQPTNPTRRAQDIDGCIALLQRTGADAVVTVLPVPTEHNPHWVYFEHADGTLALSTGEESPLPCRQALPPAFHREGSVYVTRRNVLMDQHSLYGRSLRGYPVDPETSVNIDAPEDWLRAEALVRRGAERDRL